ncbi:MAG: hypothetical protein KIH89_000345 [Candidatus Shapirobacteria bacterium]|nr:hypothetical protein [Candidatus Shapirobacteria bacterium]
MGEIGESYKPSLKDRINGLFKGKPTQEKSLDQILGELETFKQQQITEDKKRSEVLQAAKLIQTNQTQKAKSALDNYYNNMGINSSQKK